MSASPGLAFLFRDERGVIDAATWRHGLAILLAPMLAMTIAWLLLLPYANRDLTERAFVDPVSIVVYAYLMVYAAAILLASVCLYFLSAKRWRDLGRTPALAGLPLIVALVDGALHWLQPRASEIMPSGVVVAADLILLALLVWQARELGWRPTRRAA